MNFNELIENKKIIKALEEMNIFEATPIQTESIPLLLEVKMGLHILKMNIILMS